MHGPTRSCWASLTPVSLQRETQQGGPGTRAEFLELALPFIAKTLDMTLSMVNDANAQAGKGSPEKRDHLRQAFTQKQELRPSMQYAKLVTFLVWLGRGNEARSLADLAVEDGVFGRADQACSKCTRGKDGLMLATVCRRYWNILLENILEDAS